MGRQSQSSRARYVELGFSMARFSRILLGHSSPIEAEPRSGEWAFTTMIRQ
jgi:hypothetical protein